MENVGEVVASAAKLERLNRIERPLSTVDAVAVVAVNVGVSIVVNAVGAGIFVNHDGLARSVVRAGNGGVFVADHMVPISVQEEVRGKRDFWGEAKGIRGQFVEREAGGILDDNRGTLDVGVLRLHLVPNQFTFTNLRAPSRVLILHVDHAGIKVLEVSKRKHRCVFDEFQSKRHLGRWKRDRSGDLQTLVLDKGALGTQP